MRTLCGTILVAVAFAAHAGNFVKRDSLREGGELTFEMSASPAQGK